MVKKIGDASASAPSRDDDGAAGSSEDGGVGSGADPDADEPVKRDEMLPNKDDISPADDGRGLMPARMLDFGGWTTLASHSLQQASVLTM